MAARIGFSVKFLRFCFICPALAYATSWGSPKLVSTGLQNLGNTCYMNAQLQCAYHVPAIRSMVLSPDKSTDDSCVDQQDQDNVGLQALRVVFLDMAQASEKGTGPVSTRILCRGLGINVYEEQDSQEFWKLLLPALQLPSLSDLYQGAFEDFIVALDDSGRARRREEPFLDLSVDISGGSLQFSLLNLFGEPELLSNSEGNGWRPEKGADKVDAHKGSLLRVQGLPSILQIHLKRFQHDWNTGATSKVNNPVTFPELLDLSDVCENVGRKEKQQCEYDLQSIVIHAGQYGTGHYYAYVRPDVRKSEWCRFDDSIVTRGLTFDEVSADAFGGSHGQAQYTGIFGFINRLLWGSDTHGYGGESSSAYVIQYVRRQDVDTLYQL